MKVIRISRPRETDPDLFSRLKKSRICGRSVALAFPSLLVAALLVCTPANSESRQRDTLLEAKTLTEQASSLENAGNYSRAKSSGRKALTIRESLLDPRDPEVAESLDALAMIYYDEARFGEAEELLRRAIKIDANVLGSQKFQDGREIDVKRAELGAAVDHIRLSLDPNRPFDVIDAYRIYSEILMPFEQDLVQ
jgi:tetratricopeptide (TPR) repeat protein